MTAYNKKMKLEPVTNFISKHFCLFSFWQNFEIEPILN